MPVEIIRCGGCGMERKWEGHRCLTVCPCMKEASKNVEKITSHDMVKNSLFGVIKNLKDLATNLGNGKISKENQKLIDDAKDAVERL
jgi:hypothetical protein